MTKLSSAWLLLAVLPVFFFHSSLSGAEETGAAPEETLHRYCFPVMGTTAVVVLYAEQEKADRTLDAVKEAFDRVLQVANPYDPASELSRLNASAAQTPFVCSDDLRILLEEARYAWRISGKAFDITTRPLTDLWGFHRAGANPKLPGPEDRRRVLAKVGWEKVVFDDRNHTVFFSIPGMALDLGGLAKGYAVDLACEAIRTNGVRRGMVNLGGNLGLLDPPPGQEGWFIRIRDPQDPDRVLPDGMMLKNTAVSTSGDYERFVVIGGKKYGHIIDPETGLPLHRDFSVTVIAPTALRADCLSTVYYLRPETILPENGGPAGIRVLFRGGGL